ncbi:MULTISPECIES: hypothetical protein [Bacteria]|uniref:hypothetical protein n=1 Tax=Bacteria TaxID=2 RepID=UPI003C7E1132
MQRTEASAGDLRPESAGLSRRSLVKGAAWSMPVIAAAVAVPAASASVACTPGRVSLVAGATGSAVARQTVIVPGNARTITFIVRGGAGGGPQAAGSGALLTGSISPTGAPMTFDIIAGQQGHGRLGTPIVSQGFGNGGIASIPSHTPDISTGFVYTGTGGGAGSAILLNGAPLVVAGGGGGAGSDRTNGSKLAPQPPATFSGAGGSAGQGGTDGQGDMYAPGGKGANGSAPGGFSRGFAVLTNYTWATGWGAAGGVPGSGANGGGDGGNVIPGTSNYVNNQGTDGWGAGAGGGGLAGGGAGTGSFWAEPTTGGALPRFLGHYAGGGAGSSVINPGASGTFAAGGTGPGMVEISWTC